jgi:hypothetical protein
MLHTTFKGYGLGHTQFWPTIIMLVTTTNIKHKAKDNQLWEMCIICLNV